MKREKFKILSNGVRSVFAEAKSQVSYVCVFINAGSRDERRENLGAMHFIEHLLFKGTKNRSYVEILNYIESVGGELNAYTSKEETCVYVAIQNKYLERAIDVLSDVFYNSIFLKSEFLKEKEIIIDEINSYKDSPQEYILDEFEELLFSPHNLGSNILGTLSCIKKMKIGDLEHEYKNHYINSNLIVSYVGGVPLAKVMSLVDNYFGQTQTETNTNDRSGIIQPIQFNNKVNRKTYQSHCMIGTIAPSTYNESKTAMVLLNNLLGGTSFNSILNMALREERGLTYNIESNYTAYADSGIFTVYFGTQKIKVEECMDIIYFNFNKLMSEGLHKAALNSYKQQLIGQVALTFDNYNSMAISNAKSFITYEKVDSYEEIKRKIMNVTNDEIIELSKSVLCPDKLSVLLYE